MIINAYLFFFMYSKGLLVVHEIHQANIYVIYFTEGFSLFNEYGRYSSENFTYKRLLSRKNSKALGRYIILTLLAYYFF